MWMGRGVKKQAKQLRILMATRAKVRNVGKISLWMRRRDRKKLNIYKVNGDMSERLKCG